MDTTPYGRVRWQSPSDDENSLSRSAAQRRRGHSLRAQQAAMPMTGFCHLISPEARREYLAYFHRGPAGIGYIEGRNVEIEYRWAYGQNDRLPVLIADLVCQQLAVIVILESTLGALSAKAATQTIPIVFMQGADPVQIGLVRSLDQPGEMSLASTFILSRRSRSALNCCTKPCPQPRRSLTSATQPTRAGRNDRCAGCGTFYQSAPSVVGCE
jgi:hypothetical protein